MIPTKRDIITARVVERKKSEQNHVTVAATIVEVEGSIEVTGKPGYLWVVENYQTAAAVPALNINGVLALAGVPVILRKIPGKDLFRQREIIGINTESVSATDTTPVQRFATQPHRENHQWGDEANPGPDVVNVSQPAMMPFKSFYDGTTLTVKVQPLTYHMDGVFRFFAGQTVSLTSYLPSTSGLAKRVLLYLDTDTQQMAVAESAEVTAAITSPPYPPCPVRNIPSAYFYLANGQTALTSSEYDDGRMFVNMYAAGFERVSQQTTANPDVDNDEGEGYEVGSLWLNTSTEHFWIAVDVTEGAAVWAQITNDVKNNLFSLTDPTANDDSGDGYSIGSLWFNVSGDRIWGCVADGVGLAQWLRLSNTLSNYTATAAPTVNDDSGDGYEVGSLWVDVTADKSYICLDATSTAAVWRRISNILNNATSGNPTTGDDSGDGYEVLSRWLNTSTKTVWENLDATSTAAIWAKRIRNNYDATAAPATTDDASKGYHVGSKWYDNTNLRIYECQDSTTSAAVWIKTGVLNADTAWQSASFSNSWVDYGGSYAATTYRLLANGDVEMRIYAKDGTNNTVAFSVASKYRPASQYEIVAKYNLTGGAYVRVNTGGGIQLYSAAGITSGQLFAAHIRYTIFT